MSIDYYISDDELKVIIQEVTDQLADINDTNAWVDTIIFPEDELKQFITSTIYMAGMCDDAWPDNLPETQFRRRILRNFLELLGISIDPPNQ